MARKSAVATSDEANEGYFKFSPRLQKVNQRRASADAKWALAAAPEERRSHRGPEAASRLPAGDAASRWRARETASHVTSPGTR
jgi:hypothetical protein